MPRPPVTSRVMDGAIAAGDEIKVMCKTHLVSPLCSRFKTLMTNKSEQDGDGGKTIEISDMKYHIFQVGGPLCCVLLGVGGGLPQGPTALSGLGGSWELAIILHSVPTAFCVH